MTNDNQLKGVTKLLNDLQLLPKPGAPPNKNAFDRTEDPDFQILKSGVTELTKRISAYIAAAGGLGAVATGLLTWLGKINSGVQIALAAGLAFFLSLVVLSVALVVSTDLRARAMGTAAQYQARGQVAAVYEAHATETAAAATTATALASDLSIGLLAVAAVGRKATARVAKTGKTQHVTGLRYEGGLLKLRLSPTAEPPAGDSWFELTEIDEFRTIG